MISRHPSCNTLGVHNFSGDQPIVKGTTMRKRTLSFVLSLALFPAASLAFGKTVDSAITPVAPLAATASTAIPRLVQFSGVAQKVNDKSPAKVTFLLFKDQTGGDAVWIETQTVSFDSTGRYAVISGKRAYPACRAIYARAENLGEA